MNNNPKLFSLSFNFRIHLHSEALTTRGLFKTCLISYLTAPLVIFLVSSPLAQILVIMVLSELYSV